MLLRHARTARTVKLLLLLVLALLPDGAAKADGAAVAGGTARAGGIAKADGVAVAAGTATVGQVFRIDSLRWSIADVSGTPNILSELTWRDVYSNGATIRIFAAVATAGLFADVDASIVENGRNQDSDYSADNRAGEIARSVNTSNEGSMIGARLGVTTAPLRAFRAYEPAARQLPDASSTIVRVLLAASLDLQTFTITSGTQYEYSGGTTTTSPITGLNAIYETAWIGPWIGIQLETASAAPVGLYARVGVEPALYGARANWINRPFAHPVSFRHLAFGAGSELNAGATVALSQRVSIRFGAAGRAFVTLPGMDRLYFPASSGGGSFDSRLNQVEWLSATVFAGVEIRP